MFYLGEISELSFTTSSIHLNIFYKYKDANMQTVTRPSSQTVSQAVSQSGPPDHHWIGMPANSRFMAFVKKVYIKVIGKTFFFLKRKNKNILSKKNFFTSSPMFPWPMQH